MSNKQRIQSNVRIIDGETVPTETAEVPESDAVEAPKEKKTAKVRSLPARTTQFVKTHKVKIALAGAAVAGFAAKTAFDSRKSTDTPELEASSEVSQDEPIYMFVYEPETAADDTVAQ